MAYPFKFVDQARRINTSNLERLTLATQITDELPQVSRIKPVMSGKNGSPSDVGLGDNFSLPLL